MYVSWPEICENMVVDSEVFSDLEPLSAPEWSLQAEMIPSPACLLGEYLTNFLQMCSNPKSLIEILGEAAAYIDNESQGLSSAFNILTESRIPSISTVVSRTTSKSRKNVDGPISEDVLLPILYFLFPDAEEEPVRLKNNGNLITQADEKEKVVCVKDQTAITPCILAL